MSSLNRALQRPFAQEFGVVCILAKDSPVSKEELSTAFRAALGDLFEDVEISKTDSATLVGINMDHTGLIHHEMVPAIRLDWVRSNGGAAVKNLEKSFEKAWGEWCSLRRFDDGATTLAVSFIEELPPLVEQAEPGCRTPHPLIVRQIMKSIGYSATVRGDIFHDPRILPPTDKIQRTVTEAVKTIESVLKDALARDGGQMDIADVSVTSPVGRGTEVCPRRFLGHSARPVSAVLRLRAKPTGWPTNYKALVSLRAIVLGRFAKYLRKAGFDVIHLDASVLVTVAKVTVHISMEIPPELKLYDLVKSSLIEPLWDLLPKLHTTLATLSQENFAFPETVRLAKRWVATHGVCLHPLSPTLLTGRVGVDVPEISRLPTVHHSGAMAEEAVEVLVASLFINPTPFQKAPTSGQAGLGRFVDLLANTDFTKSPFIVDFRSRSALAEQITEKEREAMGRSLKAGLDTALPIFSSFDHSGIALTRRFGVDSLKRLKRFAKAALHIHSKTLVGPSSKAPLAIFKPSLGAYDILLDLPKPHKALNAIPQDRTGLVALKARGLEAEEVGTVDGHVVAETCHILREMIHSIPIIGQSAIFYSDVYGGQWVGIVLHNTDSMRPSATKLQYSQVEGDSTSSGSRMTVDLISVLSDILVSSAGLVVGASIGQTEGVRQLAKFDAQLASLIGVDPKVKGGPEKRKSAAPGKKGKGKRAH
ncbi:Nrap protein [Carpediemonas membranifera]|uniref:Nrap protein n=1 Tax=Carpediemonas membranifera TaxID=201153 RepID=A0A8J6B698_9EUKA|nr:Nrap protein [Carpediemonas membranifera]|eukprot:KAG9390882.1 Nrap protein [Carpediemonas membranifera]